jgi:hypothetical protein
MIIFAKRRIHTTMALQLLGIPSAPPIDNSENQSKCETEQDTFLISVFVSDYEAFVSWCHSPSFCLPSEQFREHC